MVGLGGGVLGDKGVGANAVVVDQVQQRNHDTLVHLVLVWKHKGVCGRLQTPQLLSSRTLRPSQQAFEAGNVSYPMLSEEIAQR